LSNSFTSATINPQRNTAIEEYMEKQLSGSNADSRISDTLQEGGAAQNRVGLWGSTTEGITR